MRAGSYHWLVEALDLFHSYTWEYSRCSISHNVLSKRRLNRLATGGYVNGWDDPRLLTLEGLRRPSSVQSFDTARTLFKTALAAFQAALDFFLLDGYVTPHIELLQLCSSLYRTLIDFEAGQSVNFFIF